MRRIDCEHCAVRGHGILKDVPPEKLPSFHRCSTTALYRRRQVIFHEGTPAAGLYILCRGAVKLYQSDRFGRDHILTIASPGDILGELPIDPTEPYSVSAEAITDAQLCFLPRDGLVRFLQESPLTGVRLIEALSKSVSTAHRKVRALALKRAENRLAELLLRLSEANGAPAGSAPPHVRLDYSRRELAEMIGVSTETAIRMLTSLKQRGAIAIQRRELVITDLAKLARIAYHDEITAPEMPPGASPVPG